MLNGIWEVKNCSICEISKKEIMSKRFNKYIAAFDFVDMTLFAS